MQIPSPVSGCSDTNSRSEVDGVAVKNKALKDPNRILKTTFLFSDWTSSVKTLTDQGNYLKG